MQALVAKNSKTGWLLTDSNCPVSIDVAMPPQFTVVTEHPNAAVADAAAYSSTLFPRATYNTLLVVSNAMSATVSDPVNVIKGVIVNESPDCLIPRICCVVARKSSSTLSPSQSAATARTAGWSA